MNPKKYSLIVVFPGTNCETETFDWLADNLETNVEYFNKSHYNLHTQDIDAIIIPGGFSFGDYLRAGAIAARSEAMSFVKKMASKNIPILGICNGFQILCESGLLEGALTKNVTQQHHHFPVSLKLNEVFLHSAVKSQNESPHCIWIPNFSNINISKNIQKYYQNFKIPMSCTSGRYIINSENKNFQPVLFYIINENGSMNSIAGITNKEGNILGLMPHPERASSKFVGSTDGLIFLSGLAQNKNIQIKENSELKKFNECIN